MNEEEWLASFDLRRMAWVASSKLSERRYRLFAVACCSLYREVIRQRRLRKAVRLAERSADGDVSDLELQRALAMVESTPREGQLRGGVQAVSYPSLREGFLQDLIKASVSAAVGQRVREAVAFPSFGEMEQEAHLLRDIVGNPFRPVAFHPAWRTSDVMLLAQGIYDKRDFGAMPILADALQDARCDNEAILSHCRDASLTHVRGCWVIDLVLGKG